MKKVFNFLIPLLLLILIGLIIGWLLNGADIAVLNPKGSIAAQQFDLMVFSTLLMLVIVVPVFVLTFAVAWRYREGNKKTVYRPDWDGSGRLESVWWGVPFIIIAILSVVIWNSSYALDPSKPIDSDKKPLQVQVVALQWKWLFLYPEQRIATVNYVHLPEDRPVTFSITADAPMSSLWIPHLGGQIYAMNGMRTTLNLLPEEVGNYRGASANINGKGFADMHFKAEVSVESQFNNWVSKTQQSMHPLDPAEYHELSEPGTVKKPMSYSSFKQGLFDDVIAEYMSPEGEDHHMKREGY